MEANLNVICNEYCRLCSSNNNVVNVFSKELINSDKLQKYIFTCSGVNILSNDVVTKYVCHPCLEIIRKIMKFRKDSINNDLKLKNFFLREDNIDEKKMKDIDIDDVFNFLPPLEKQVKIEEENVNKNCDLNVNNVNLDLTENNNSELIMPLSIDLNIIKTCGTVEYQVKEEIEMNTDEFEDLTIKKEIVMVVGSPEDVELEKNVKVLKREYISNDADPLNELSEEILNEKEEGNKLTKRENEVHLNKFKNMITKEVVIVLEDCLLKKNELKIQTSNNVDENVNTNKIYSNSDEKSYYVKKRKFIDLDETKSYKCPECGKHFGILKSFKTHLHIHSGVKKHECTECGKRFFKISGLKEHRLIHSGEKPHKCLECGRCFRQPGSLRSHQLVHSGKKPHKCLECGKCFLVPSKLKKHQHVHSGSLKKNELKVQTSNNMNESVNTNKIDSNSDEKSHVKRRNFVDSDKKKTYKCPECGKHLRTSRNLRVHRRIHSGVKPYECTECGKRFHRSSNLKTHQLIHSSEKTYKCLECGKCFRQLSGLHGHRLIHSDKKPHKCSVCGKQFCHLTTMKIHRLSHSGEKPYECSECGKHFRSLDTMNNHRFLHSSDNPNVCTKCGKCFQTKRSLERHLLIHSDAKTFKCPDCEKHFRSKYSLKQHRLIHSDIKPFECTECGKRFRQKYKLYVHQFTHLDEKPSEKIL